MSSTKIRIGISQCLLGAKVRYDGQHKHSKYITQNLGPFFEFVPFCPENDSGMGTPRESMHLRGDVEAPRLIGNRSGEDKTDQLLSYTQQRVPAFSNDDIAGIIFKKGSPSCGVYGVTPKTEKGMPGGKSGAGLFVREVQRSFPNLPIEEEGRLNDPGLRELFIEKVFTHHRWREAEKAGWTSSSLLAFHERHKYLLMSHSPERLRTLGRLLSDMKARPIDHSADLYFTTMMQIMGLKPTVKKQRNVLMHIMGYFKKNLTSSEKEELIETIDTYSEGLLPLIVPITLLKHYVRKYEQPYLQDQVYLQPHPTELMIRAGI